MDFEWDENKNRINIEKHGIDFDDAISIFEENPVVRPSKCAEEQRYLAVGELRGRRITVVFTIRGDAVRVISARRARKNE